MPGEMLNNLYEVLDERFRTGRCANGDARLERAARRLPLGRGTALCARLAAVDLERHPQDRLPRRDEATGAIGAFRSPAGHMPEPVSNIALGGPKNNQLFITATTSPYTLMMSATGLPRVL